MKLSTLMLGALSVYCYILSNDDGECVVIDIGGSAPVLLRHLEQEKLTLQGILLTHGHYDHISGTEQVRQQWNVPVYIHKNDEAMLTSMKENLGDWIEPGANFQPVQQWQTIQEGDVLEFGSELVLKVLHTPGHTKGSVCYVCGNLLFSGDTLFRMSRGRTDFPGGNDREMLDSLRKLARLEGEYRVLPGHDGESTLSFERRHNPNLRGY